MAPHSSALAWKIPWMEEPGGLQSMGSLSQTRLSNFTFTFHFHALEEEMATHSSVLAWRIPGAGEPGRLPSMGSHRVGHDWSDLAATVAAACTFHINGNIQYEIFYTCLFSFSIMFFKIIQIVACFTGFLFFYDRMMIHYTDIPYFI